MEANEYQIGGKHYDKDYQHWDMVCDTDMPYIIAVAIKYVDRYKKKNGTEDLRKSLHYVSKAEEEGIYMPTQLIRDSLRKLLGMKTYRRKQYDSFFKFLSQHGSYRDKRIMMNIFLGKYKEATGFLNDEILKLENDGSEPTDGYVNQDSTYFKG